MTVRSKPNPTFNLVELDASIIEHTLKLSHECVIVTGII